MLLDVLQAYTGLSEKLLNWYAITASKRYKVYTIPKRTGGVRTIEQPSKQIKALQRILNKIIFEKFPIHSAATAYRKGSNIRKNALIHSNSNFTLHVDLESFFPSFKSANVELFLKEKCHALSIKVDQNDIEFICKIVCRYGALTIGAPSSPALTNILMFDFDVQFDKWCQAQNLSYSRYADDLFISSQEPNKLENALIELRNLLEKFKFGSLSVNEKKLAFLSRRYRRSVTGLILTPERKVSIGRDRKQKIKSEIYCFKKGTLSPEKLGALVGMIAFANDAEPDFVELLRNKYGKETLENITNQISKRYLNRKKEVPAASKVIRKNLDSN
jgi:RNA-directed DNA polymerase